MVESARKKFVPVIADTAVFGIVGHGPEVEVKFWPVISPHGID